MAGNVPTKVSSRKVINVFLQNVYSACVIKVTTTD